MIAHQSPEPSPKRSLEELRCMSCGKAPTEASGDLGIAYKIEDYRSGCVYSGKICARCSGESQESQL